MPTIIEALRSYLASYSGLADGAPVWVNNLSGVNEYAIIQLPGGKVIQKYIGGGGEKEFPFAFQSMLSTADDAARLENVGFFELFSDWLESQTEAGELPDLGTKKTATSIEALTWGYLYEQGESGTGIYQINCRLVYEQEP